MLIRKVGLCLLLCLSSFSGTDFSYKFNVKTKLGIVKFIVHGKDYNEQFANDILEFANKKVPAVVEYFNYAVENTIHIIIKNKEPESNGAATVFPRDLIYLYTAQPLGPGYLTTSVNYYQKLFLHEFIHILHLERTEGFVDTLETIFGSIARVLPSTVPRWFAEGIAMWGEDHFSNEGRLKNPYLIQEISTLLTDGKTCQNVGCLDVPGVYPGGSLAYWAGGHFLKFLENRRKGTISCMVRINASNLPFFLNSVFNECAGQDVDEAFEDYKKSLKVSNTFQYSYQKGVFFNGEDLYFFKEIDRKNFLVKKSLLTNKREVIDLKSAIRFIQDSTKELRIVSVSDQSTKRVNVVSSLTEDFELKELNRQYQYSFSIGEKEVSLKFNKSLWEIHIDGKVSTTLPSYATLVRPYAFKGKLHFFSYHGGGYSIISFNPESGNLKTSFKSAQTMSFIGLCDGEGAFYRVGDKYVQFDGKKISSLVAKKKGSINFISKSGGRVVLLRRILSHYKGNCGELFKASAISFKKVVATKKAPVTNEPYFSLDYLMPKYWFFSYANTEDDQMNLGVFTSISDPLEKHTLNLNLDYYTNQKSYGGKLNYTYDFSFMEYHLNYFKILHKNNLNPDLELYDESISTLLTKSFYLSNFELQAGVIYSRLQSKDIFSSDKSTNYGGLLSLIKYPRYRYQLFNNLNFSGLAQRVDTEGGLAFNRYQFTGLVNFDLYKNLIFSLKSTWTKLDKDTFNHGIEYGGGTYKSIHQFYGLDYSDVFGNEIKTVRLKLEMPIIRSNKGWGFLPFYIKEYSLIGGRDYIESDFIVYNNKLHRNTSVSSLFYGVGVSTYFFYRVPIKFDFIFANTELENGETKSVSTIVISGGYYF